MKKRHGYIYSEMTNHGRCSTKLVKGAPPVYCFRWVGEIMVNGKRFRFRSTNRDNVEAWLEDMRRKYADVPVITGARAHKRMRVS